MKSYFLDYWLNKESFQERVLILDHHKHLYVEFLLKIIDAFNNLLTWQIIEFMRYIRKQLI